MTKPTSRSAIIERVMTHPADKIWRALTQSSLIEEWLMENDFQPVVGHKFNLRTAPMPHWDGLTDCEVLVIEPNTRLSYSWNAAGAVRTVVTWTLSPTEGGTLVRMEQSGFRPDQDFNYRGAMHGWQQNFASLERVIAGLV